MNGRDDTTDPTSVAGLGDERKALIGDESARALGWTRWRERADQVPAAIARSMRDLLRHAPSWLDVMFGNSPFLTAIALREPQLVIDLNRFGPDASFAELRRALNQDHGIETRAAVMTDLRRAKRAVALATAMSDLAGIWPLERVTSSLSAFAELALNHCLRHLLLAAAGRGDFVASAADAPERGSGIIILGMGKLGAEELNYSSDIDLIILFDPERLPLPNRENGQSFMSRLARDLVTLMEERTAEGYVFRTDLRLRPDPASTPPAVSTEAAEVYYASVGQNWERAAMIKARPVAGDLEAGDSFLATLRPFLWRRNLDFAAIQDIHSIKRQIAARHGSSLPDLAGYNVKLGHGGIREIELFAQTQQLIWGGRIPALRQRATVAALRALAAAGQIGDGDAQALITCYRFLRTVEHRLQMVEDRQTHALPIRRDELERFARFMGHERLDDFAAALIAVAGAVNRRFAGLFPEEQPLSSAGGNLVFTGTEDDPETLATLGGLGFRHPERAASAVRGWHHGRIRATRSQRARELLTELVPEMLRVFGRTAAPDAAFARFDEFLARLPAGVQLFSLFRAHPELLELVAEIMGDAPALGVRLSRKPSLLDAVLSGDFFSPLPVDAAASGTILCAELAALLDRAGSFEEILDAARRWTADWKFRIGAQLFFGHLDGGSSGRHFAAVADAVIAVLLPHAAANLARTHGDIPGGRFVVLAMGKLGSREMTALSDLDLVFIYDAPDFAASSTGAKPLSVPAYYARLAQRLINALTAPTAEGGLYEVDMRLRPSGNAGPTASSLESFRRYQQDHAWTWEHMALTRARVVAGDASLEREVTATITRILTRAREPARLLADVADMRRRIAEQHDPPRSWDCKHRRGGLVDIEFIVQYLQLRDAAARRNILATGNADALRRLGDAGCLAPELVPSLLRALAFWQQVQGVQRVALENPDAEGTDASLLERVLMRATKIADPIARKAALDEMAATVTACYETIIARPAAQAARAADPSTHPELGPP